MSYNLSKNAKTVIALLVVVAILIPIVLGTALAYPCALPYLKQEGANCPTATSAASITSTSSGPTSASSSATTAMVILPQGASGGLNFSPDTLTVASGTTITFVDQDSGAPHNVYFTSVPSGATNPNPAAGPPTITKGDTYTVTLTTPGTYNYECQFHSTWMKATITVTG
jgi:plastocyanin